MSYRLTFKSKEQLLNSPGANQIPAPVMIGVASSESFVARDAGCATSVKLHTPIRF